jgi:hypothetical protein
MLDGELLINENRFMIITGVFPSGVGDLKHNIWAGETGSYEPGSWPRGPKYTPISFKK